MKYYIFTLGCQMNISDSERITTKLNQLGHKPVKTVEEADLIVVNSCSVRQKGIDRIWGGIKKWKAGNKKILITGCVIESDRKKYAEREIDFMHIDDLPKLDKKLNLSENSQNQHYLEIVPEFSGTIAYIPIMTGCDNFCSYCAVPYTRGREVSRPITDIIAETENALTQGFKEVWFLGQNVNSYKYDFAKLLTKIDAVRGDFKFNFISSNPQDMTDEIIHTFASLKKWTKELHLAMQSGDDEILRKMNRKCTADQFLKLTEKLKKEIPGIKLSTDLIVGFPAETKAQHENTVKMCEKINFTKAYVNQYSPREGTVSAKMKDSVSAVEKKERWLELDKLINKNCY